jgi:hypothetical protein
MSDDPKGPAQRDFERELVRTETLIVESHPEGVRTVLGTSRNLSKSGIFVESSAELKIGDEVQLFVGSMRSAAALRAVAKVVHVEPGVGFGARFTDEDEESRECVAAFIHRFKKPEQG